MPALTRACRYTKLSFYHDTFTLYPTFEYYQNPGLRNCLEAIAVDCGKLDFVIKFLPDQTPTKENLEFVKGLTELKQDHAEFDRYVRRVDPDHWLYHKDTYHYDDSHWHIKFKSILTRAQLSLILNIFAKHQILSSQEKEAYLKDYDLRYKVYRLQVAKSLWGNKDKDMRKIIEKFIMTCPDNDLLADLNKFLSSEKFDYLREMSSADVVGRWCGVDRSNQAVATSKAWSWIQKAIRLQMSLNIKKDVKFFTPQIGSERTKQLTRAFSYFNSKSRPYVEGQGSKIAVAFANGDEKELARIQDKVKTQIQMRAKL